MGAILPLAVQRLASQSGGIRGTRSVHDHYSGTAGRAARQSEYWRRVRRRFRRPNFLPCFSAVAAALIQPSISQTAYCAGLAACGDCCRPGTTSSRHKRVSVHHGSRFSGRFPNLPRRYFEATLPTGQAIRSPADTEAFLTAKLRDLPHELFCLPVSRQQAPNYSF